MYVTYVGKLFLRMLKALILPLIIPSLVAAVGSLGQIISEYFFFTNEKIWQISALAPKEWPSQKKLLC